MRQPDMVPSGKGGLVAPKLRSSAGGWPDWRGRAVAVIASGPSAKQAGVGALKGRLPVLAIKKNIDLAPFADAVYGCDAPWWRDVRGLPKFAGFKFAYDPGVCDEFGLTRILIPDINANRLAFDKVGSVGAAGNSGFQALNLAAQFGATRILLVGFDAHGRSGEHWYGRNGWNFANNPTEDNYRRWRAAFDAAATDLAERGIEVINASPVLSDIRAFPKMTIPAALEHWRL
jgi:hypothetical protein